MFQLLWNSFLLEFGIQEWDQMNPKRRGFLKNLKFTNIEPIFVHKLGSTSEREKALAFHLSYKKRNEIFALRFEKKTDMLTYGFEDFNDVFNLGLSGSELTLVNDSFYKFYDLYVKSQFSDENIKFISKDMLYEEEDESEEENLSMSETIAASKREAPDTKESNKLRKIIDKWYRDGFATWEYQGASGKDGAFGGSFHYIEELSIFDGGYTFIIDFGSADEGDALYSLAHKVNSIGFEVATSEYPNEIILQKTKNTH